MTTFRSTSRRLLAVALAITAAFTMGAGYVQSASAANPPDLGDGPVGPSGCRGDCGPFEHPNPNGHPKPKRKCGPATGRSCEPRPGCSGGVCTPPPPPGYDPVRDAVNRYSDASSQCDAGDAAGCDYIHTHSLPVIEGSHTGTGGGFIQMYPTNADGEVDYCAQDPGSARCIADRARRESANNINGIDPADFDTVDTGTDPAGSAADDGGVDNGLAEFAAENGIDPADLAAAFGDAQGGL